MWFKSFGGSRILKQGPAARVIFFSFSDEGTYVDGAQVTLYESGIVHIVAPYEETTTHLQNCEIIWHFELEKSEGDNKGKVRLLKPRAPEQPHHPSH